MATKAYVLIKVKAGRTKEVLKTLKKIDGSSKREYQGAGLGLAIANRLVGIMGGELSIESKPGAGSKFSFTLGFPKASAVTARAS